MSLEIISSLAEKYISEHTSPESIHLQSVSENTLKNHPHAHMLSGHVQGRFLAFISNIMQPKYVLEIGTFTGYSALCLAEGLQMMENCIHRNKRRRCRNSLKKF